MPKPRFVAEVSYKSGVFDTGSRKVTADDVVARIEGVVLSATHRLYRHTFAISSQEAADVDDEQSPLVIYIQVPEYACSGQDLSTDAGRIADSVVSYLAHGDDLAGWEVNHGNGLSVEVFITPVLGGHAVRGYIVP